MGNSPCLKGNEKQISKIALLSNKCYNTHKHRVFRGSTRKEVQPRSEMKVGGQVSQGTSEFTFHDACWGLTVSPHAWHICRISEGVSSVAPEPPPGGLVAVSI